ncbi:MULTISPECIES: ferritin-like domain-containing protein [unclassified Leeuwenhoekiella]|uniref:ferritin-like domain-containing protein n=1 Tax=unclassified Leeuwenhoekiella TaxID=2615029 RepID=UPI000C5B52DD|nr:MULTISPECIES: ferritin-like domain-containing protein [unclassified Leeuwenhoekiella]MAW95017.1 hypothetical protein [Leeuwenhoekiella sp.]MBA79737.1 hypothetical protein [Leeuwenhoekiella sp.]|tara:strand:- start:28788 stop:29519 length:732 start_codon:yes stop_codon:yes gene_type:complete
MRKKESIDAGAQTAARNRRNFLKVSGLALAGSGLLLASCDNDDDGYMNPDDVFDLGSGDVGVLNYAYALEQLEAAFYTNVLDGSYWAGADTEEKAILEDLYNHEVNHRDWFKAAIGANVTNPAQRLPDNLEFDFSSVDFSNRTSVLQTAQALEDTGVGAYNGAGIYIQTPLYLTLAGKIVSVEARHAAAIRSIINPTGDFKAFAGNDIVDDNGLDAAYTPTKVFENAGPFIVTPFTYKNPMGS